MTNVILVTLAILSAVIVTVGAVGYGMYAAFRLGAQTAWKAAGMQGPLYEPPNPERPDDEPQETG